MIEKPKYPNIIYEIPIVLQTIINTQEELVDEVNSIKIQLKEIVRSICLLQDEVLKLKRHPESSSSLPKPEDVSKDVKYLCGGCNQIHQDKDFDPKVDKQVYYCGHRDCPQICKKEKHDD